MFVVTVEFRIRDAHAAAFLDAVRRNAALSLSEEPGCHRFDVCTAPDDPAEVFLYELYTDAAAFDAHKAAAHYRAFDAQVGPWVAEKVVRTYRLEGALHG